MALKKGLLSKKDDITKPMSVSDILSSNVVSKPSRKSRKNKNFGYFSVSPPMIGKVHSNDMILDSNDNNKSSVNTSINRSIIDTNFIDKIISSDINNEKTITIISFDFEFDFDILYKHFMDKSSNNKLDFVLRGYYEDALHFDLMDSKICNNINKTDNQGRLRKLINGSDIFLIEFGVIVFWNVNNNNQLKFIELIIDMLELDKNELTIESDVLTYIYNNIFKIEKNFVINISINALYDTNNIEKIKQNDYNEIKNYEFNGSNDNSLEYHSLLDRVQYIINDNVNNNQQNSGINCIKILNILQKLSISLGLSQSIKMEHFETKIANLIELNNDLNLDMSRNGRININMKDINKRIGKLYLLRCDLNFESKILDVPELFWECDVFFKEYQSICQLLLISNRFEILNSRFNLLHDLFKNVHENKQIEHENRLEWIIIILIILEVLFEIISLCTDNPHWFQ